MEFATDNLIARVLLTISTLGYSLALVFADFNKTHATNPLWTGHARFHVVWQVLSNCGVALIALALIWTAGPIAKLWLAAIFAVVIYAAFFAAALTMKLFGGALLDVNGIPPLTTLNIGGRPLQVDANVTVFGGMALIAIIAMLMIR